MPTVLNISEAAVLGLHAAALLAAHPEKHLSAREMAETLGASEAHLAKVMQRLGHVGLVRSMRGRHGGFRLARAASRIRLLDVYEAIEGPLAEGACLLQAPACSQKHCLLGGLLRSVNRQVKDYLGKTRLSDLAIVKELASCLPEGAPARRAKAAAR
jgi:Rrf2 family nitric oxide-sensitive transcriptional repressor